MVRDNLGPKRKMSWNVFRKRRGILTNELLLTWIQAQSIKTHLDLIKVCQSLNVECPAEADINLQGIQRLTFNSKIKNKSLSDEIETLKPDINENEEFVSHVLQTGETIQKQRKKKKITENT